MVSDSPLAGLLCALFVGPLGIQGFVIDPTNTVYNGLGKHQRHMSYALWSLLALSIALGIASTVTVVNDEKAATPGLGIAYSVSSLALWACSFASFIIAIVLLVRSKGS
jgi:hypothetical protein